MNSGGWTNLGTWRVWAPPSPPSAPYVASFEASGSQAEQLVTLKFNGSGASSPAQALINSALDGRYACYLAYDGSRYLYLLNDQGNGLLPNPVDLVYQSGGGASNSQCTLNSATRPIVFNNYMTIAADVTFKPAFMQASRVVFGGVQTGGGNSGWQPMALLFGPNATGIAAPSILHSNLGAIPVDVYDNTTPKTQVVGLQGTCSSNSTHVQDCYKEVLANLRSQGVSAVAFTFAMCDGPGTNGSTPILGCGTANPSSPDPNWVSKMTSFLNDVYNAGIYTIVPRFSHSTGSVSMGPGDHGVQYGPVGNPISGGQCAGLGSVTQEEFIPTQPFGLIACTNTPPYYCPSGQNCTTYCQPNAGFPFDDGRFGYTCSPANPYFVGWNIIDSVFLAVIQAAYNSCGNGNYPCLDIAQLDVEPEINVTSFPVEARFIYDDAQGGNVSHFGQIQAYMTVFGYDAGRVTYAIADSQVNQALFDCTDAYGGPARLQLLTGYKMAISAGPIGSPSGSYSQQHLLLCGGNMSGAESTPMVFTLPRIWDYHTYPCVIAVSGASHDDWGCSSSSPGVEGEAQQVSSDLKTALSLYGTPLATVALGETWTNSIDPTNSSQNCEGGPAGSAPNLVTGFDSSSLAGQNIQFRPFINLQHWVGTLQNPISCYTPANQSLNSGNQGPFTPTRQ